MIAPVHTDDLPTAESSASDEQSWIFRDISLPVASGIFLLFMLLVYWPVFLGQRFFWEDFFIQEYPIREYCFYMVRFQHTLPFWNPYSWAWSPLLADAQSGFWYPTNLLQIAIVWLTMPHALHLPVIVSETLTLLHMPIAALGVFALLKKEFRVTGVAALLAGLCWGFGIRMAAEQNHSMQIIQLALLPWEALLLIHAWKSWRYGIGLGLVLGISFLAGQQQTFFFFAIFLSLFTIAECVIRWRTKRSVSQAATPLIHFMLAMIVAVGFASIQLFPTMELVAYSGRTHLDFNTASSNSIHLGHLINFFVPKFYGEYPGFTIPKSPIAYDHFEYWETAFYWSMLGEIFALFAIVTNWKRRGKEDLPSRHLFFFAAFSIFAIGYGLGKNFIFQWPIWRFVPLFNHFRGPNRMIWLAWFTGTLMAGIGLDTLFRNPNAVREAKRYFYWVSGIFVTINVIAISGALDYAFEPHTLRSGLRTLLLPSLIFSILTAIFLLAIIHKKLSLKFLIPCAALLLASDLWYNDFTWHRNTLDRETLVAQDSSSHLMQAFRMTHGPDHAKLLIVRGNNTLHKDANLGMFLRLPIEDAADSTKLRILNPLLLQSAFPSVRNSVRRMEIMGVATSVSDSGVISNLPNVLPFLKLYRDWRISPKNNDSVILNDSTFDFTKVIVPSELPVLSPGFKSFPDTVILIEYGENLLRMKVTASQPSILLVNDLYYPAWQATVDGKKTKILRAFTSLRAIPINAGEHTVEMHYDDWAFDLGWKITLGTFAVSLVALCIGKKQKNPEINRGSSI